MLVPRRVNWFTNSHFPRYIPPKIGAFSPKLVSEIWGLRGLCKGGNSHPRDVWLKWYNYNLNQELLIHPKKKGATQPRQISVELPTTKHQPKKQQKKTQQQKKHNNNNNNQPTNQPTNQPNKQTNKKLHNKEIKQIPVTLLDYRCMHHRCVVNVPSWDSLCWCWSAWLDWSRPGLDVWKVNLRWQDNTVLLGCQTIGLHSGIEETFLDTLWLRLCWLLFFQFQLHRFFFLTSCIFFHAFCFKNTITRYPFFVATIHPHLAIPILAIPRPKWQYHARSWHHVVCSHRTIGLRFDIPPTDHLGRSDQGPTDPNPSPNGRA